MRLEKKTRHYIEKFDLLPEEVIKDMIDKITELVFLIYDFTNPYNDVDFGDFNDFP